MVDWSRLGRHARYGNGLKRAKYRGWLYPVVVVVGSLLVHLLQDDRRRSLAKTNIVVYVFGSILHVIPWETPRAYVLALAADFCAITGVYTTHVRAYCRSTAPASTPTDGASCGSSPPRRPSPSGGSPGRLDSELTR